MTFKQLHYFLGVLRAGSITAAAQSLHVAQPAIGAQIRALEEELGVKLVVRHSRGVAPTEAGASLARDAARLVEEVERLRKDIMEMGHEPRGGAVEKLREHETGESPIAASRLHEMARLLGVTVGFFFENAAGTGGDALDTNDIGDELAHRPSAGEVSRLIRQFARISDPKTRALAIDRMKAIAERRLNPPEGRRS